MVSTLDSGVSTMGSSPGCHGVMFLGKTGACLHPVVSMGTPKFITGGTGTQYFYSQGGGGIQYSLHATETGINSNLMSYLACMQTLPF